MGPNGAKMLRIVAGVVVEGMDPIQSARVGVDCTSIPAGAPAVEARTFTFMFTGPFAFEGCAGAESALPNPILTG